MYHGCKGPLTAESTSGALAMRLSHMMTPQPTLSARRAHCHRSPWRAMQQPTSPGARSTRALARLLPPDRVQAGGELTTPRRRPRSSSSAPRCPPAAPRGSTARNPSNISTQVASNSHHNADITDTVLITSYICETGVCSGTSLGQDKAPVSLAWGDYADKGGSCRRAS